MEAAKSTSVTKQYNKGFIEALANDLKFILFFRKKKYVAKFDANDVAALKGKGFFVPGLEVQNEITELLAGLLNSDNGRYYLSEIGISEKEFLSNFDYLIDFCCHSHLLRESFVSKSAKDIAEMVCDIIVPLSTFKAESRDDARFDFDAFYTYLSSRYPYNRSYVAIAENLFSLNLMAGHRGQFLQETFEYVDVREFLRNKKIEFREKDGVVSIFFDKELSGQLASMATYEGQVSYEEQFIGPDGEIICVKIIKLFKPEHIFVYKKTVADSEFGVISLAQVFDEMLFNIAIRTVGNPKVARQILFEEYNFVVGAKIFSKQDRDLLDYYFAMAFDTTLDFEDEYDKTKLVEVFDFGFSLQRNFIASAATDALFRTVVEFGSKFCGVAGVSAVRFNHDSLLVQFRDVIKLNWPNFNFMKYEVIKDRLARIYIRDPLAAKVFNITELEDSIIAKSECDKAEYNSLVEKFRTIGLRERFFSEAVIDAYCDEIDKQLRDLIVEPLYYEGLRWVLTFAQKDSDFKYFLLTCNQEQIMMMVNLYRYNAILNSGEEREGEIIEDQYLTEVDFSKSDFISFTTSIFDVLRLIKREGEEAFFAAELFGIYDAISRHLGSYVIGSAKPVMCLIADFRKAAPKSRSSAVTLPKAAVRSTAEETTAMGGAGGDSSASRADKKKEATVAKRPVLDISGLFIIGLLKRAGSEPTLVRDNSHFIEISFDKKLEARPKLIPETSPYIEWREGNMILHKVAFNRNFFCCRYKMFDVVGSGPDSKDDDLEITTDIEIVNTVFALIRMHKHLVADANAARMMELISSNMDFSSAARTALLKKFKDLEGLIKKDQTILSVSGKELFDKMQGKLTGFLLEQSSDSGKFRPYVLSCLLPKMRDESEIVSCIFEEDFGQISFTLKPKTVLPLKFQAIAGLEFLPEEVKIDKDQSKILGVRVVISDFVLFALRGYDELRAGLESAAAFASLWQETKAVPSVKGKSKKTKKASVVAAAPAPAAAPDSLTDKPSLAENLSEKVTNRKGKNKSKGKAEAVAAPAPAPVAAAASTPAPVASPVKDLPSVFVKADAIDVPPMSDSSVKDKSKKTKKGSVVAAAPVPAAAPTPVFVPAPASITAAASAPAPVAAPVPVLVKDLPSVFVKADAIDVPPMPDLAPDSVVESAALAFDLLRISEAEERSRNAILDRIKGKLNIPKKNSDSEWITAFDWFDGAEAFNEEFSGIVVVEQRGKIKVVIDKTKLLEKDYDNLAKCLSARSKVHKKTKGAFVKRVDDVVVVAAPAPDSTLASTEIPVAALALAQDPDIVASTVDSALPLTSLEIPVAALAPAPDITSSVAVPRVSSQHQNPALASYFDLCLFRTGVRDFAIKLYELMMRRIEILNKNIQDVGALITKIKKSYKQDSVYVDDYVSLLEQESSLLSQVSETALEQMKRISNLKGAKILRSSAEFDFLNQQLNLTSLSVDERFELNDKMQKLIPKLEFLPSGEDQKIYLAELRIQYNELNQWCHDKVKELQTIFERREQIKAQRLSLSQDVGKYLVDVSGGEADFVEVDDAIKVNVFTAMSGLVLDSVEKLALRFGRHNIFLHGSILYKSKPKDIDLQVELKDSKYVEGDFLKLGAVDELRNRMREIFPGQLITIVPVFDQIHHPASSKLEAVSVKIGDLFDITFCSKSYSKTPNYLSYIDSVRVCMADDKLYFKERYLMDYKARWGYELDADATGYPNHSKQHYQVYNQETKQAVPRIIYQTIGNHLLQRDQTKVETIDGLIAELVATNRYRTKRDCETFKRKSKLKGEELYQFDQTLEQVLRIPPVVVGISAKADGLSAAAAGRK